MIKKNDKEELIKLIQENPNLPIVFFINNDEIALDYGSTVMEDFRVYKSKIYKYKRFGDICYTDDINDVIEYYWDFFAEEEEYKNLSNEEYKKEIDKYIDENIENYEAIVLYVS